MNIETVISYWQVYASISGREMSCSVAAMLYPSDGLRRYIEQLRVAKDWAYLAYRLALALVVEPERRALKAADRWKYPLYCIDNGQNDEWSFRGPFETAKEAIEAHARFAGTIRRCRRLRPSEVVSVDIDDLRERLDEEIGEGWPGPARAWANFDEPILVAAEETVPGRASEAMDHWLDEHCRVDAFVCEGDEDDDGQEGGA